MNYTPLVAHRWESHLQNYPDRELAQFFLEGITQGFKIGFNSGSTTLKSATRNLPGALLHPKVVEEYIQEELALSLDFAAPILLLPALTYTSAGSE